MRNLSESFEDDQEASGSEPEEGGAEPEIHEGDDNNEADEAPPTKKRKTDGSAAPKYEGPA